MTFHPSVEIVLDADLTGQPNTWSWTDYTDRFFQGDRISITRGRNDRYTSAPPARCALVADNTDGLLVPTNPMSELYGRIGINTPLRVLMRGETNSAADTFTRSVSNGWGTSSSGSAWTSAGTAANHSVSSTFGRHTHGSANVPLYDTLNSFTMLRSDITVRVKVNALSTGAAQTAAIVTRFVDSSNANRCEFRFGTDQSIQIRLVHRIAGTDTAGSTADTGLTHSTSTWVWLRVQVGKTTVRAKAWNDGGTQPRGWQLDGSAGVESSNSAAGKPGLFSIRETGNTNASATIDFDDFTLVDGSVPQFTGYVDEWPAKWSDASGNLPFVPIAASGQLKRIQQEPTLRSALYRAHTEDYRSASPTVVAYWPMEDGSNSRQFASAVNGPPMNFANWTPASDSTFKGSDGLPVAGNGSGSFVGAVRAYTSPSPNAWSVRAVAKFPTAAASGSALIQWRTTGGSMWRWQLILNTGSPDTFNIQAFDSAGAEKLSATSVNFTNTIATELYGSGLYLRADATQNGSNIDWSFGLTFIDSNGSPTTKSSSGSAAGTLGNVALIYSTTQSAFSGGGYTFGHVGAGTSTGWGPSDADAISGYAGESTSDRFFRLGAEQNFAVLFGDLTSGSTTSEQLMGPQDTGTMLGQLQQVETTEEGILFDGKQGHVQILPRSFRRNHSVDLDLDISAGHVNWPFEPTLDRLLFKNDVTATNPSGTSYRKTATGDVSPSAKGTYQESITVNTYLEADLDNHANFRLAAGVIAATEGRLPQLKLNFARNPTLILDWLDADVGSRVNVSNPPGELDPTPLDVLLEGSTEIIGQEDWTATLNCSPATVWNSFTLEASGNQGRLDTDGSHLVVDYDSDDTTMVVASSRSPFKLSDTPIWSTTAEPYDWEVSGERITVGTMGTSAATFVSVGTAAHGDNASVVPGMPASIQKGDYLVILTAIRNTSAFAGAVTNPGGWDILANGQNVILLGRHWDGSFTAPTCAFAGGSAGDTTSAQIAAFRHVQGVVAVNGTLSVQSNASAQNIAVPGVDADRYRTLILACAWKQDDYTSVATLSGFTELAEASTTTGNDQSLIWDYRILSGTTTLVAGTTFVVTGGASAISKAFMIALASDVQSATVTRSVNGVTKSQVSGTAVRLWRPGRVAL